MAVVRNRRIVFRKDVVPGAPPGTVRAPSGAAPPKLEAFVFDGESLTEHHPLNASEAFGLCRPGAVLWLDVSGLGDAEILEGFRDEFGLPGLALEDVGSTGQRPKFEDYHGVLFVIARMIRCPERPLFKGHIEDEQVAFFIGENFVVTFQEQGGDSFDPVRDRLRRGRPSMRNGGPGYLFVALLDAIVDGYFPVIEVVSERLEALEVRVIHETSNLLLEEVYSVRREILALRRAFWPLRDVTNGLLRDLHERIPEATRHNLRDVGDHVVQAVDVIETYRELAASLVDVHLSMVSQRTNEVVRVLTVVTTVFIPLSFLAGVYGMNFDHQPELHWQAGYGLFWGACALVVSGLLYVFFRLGWLAPPQVRDTDRERQSEPDLARDHSRES